MLLRSFWLLAVPVVLCAAKAPGGLSKQDTSWGRYNDPDRKFCMEYPKHWIRSDAAGETGIAFSTGEKRYSMPVGEIDVTVLTTPDDSSQLLQAHMEGVKKFVRAEEMQILDSENITVDGTPATLMKDRYRDRLEKQDWTEEIIYARHDDKLYRLEVVSRSDEAARFQLMFGRMVRSFSFECHGK